MPAVKTRETRKARRLRATSSLRWCAPSPTGPASSGHQSWAGNTARPATRFLVSLWRACWLVWAFSLKKILAPKRPCSLSNQTGLLREAPNRVKTGSFGRVSLHLDIWTSYTRESAVQRAAFFINTGRRGLHPQNPPSVLAALGPACLETACEPSFLGKDARTSNADPDQLRIPLSGHACSAFLSL